MLWVDFSYYLSEKTWKAEDDLWRDLATKCKWVIGRGAAFGAEKPGWMRIVFTK